jgi:CheY-like chemotaxis protein
VASKTVLVVEDGLEESFLLDHQLRDAGFETIVVASGEAALGELASWPPDAVILDLNVRGADAWETLGRLRDQAKSQDVPVILLTGRDGAAERRRALGERISTFIAKPWTTATLLRDLRTALA